MARRVKGDTINLKVGAMGLLDKGMVRLNNRAVATVLRVKDMVRLRAVMGLPDKGMVRLSNKAAAMGLRVNKATVRLSNRVVAMARPGSKAMVRLKGATARLGNKATVRPDKAVMEARPKGVVMVLPGNKATVHLRGAMARLGKGDLVPDPVGLEGLSAHGLGFRADALGDPAEAARRASCWCPRS